MSEKQSPDDLKAVQTDRESQEYGALHGQDVAGNETGSSAPVAGADGNRADADAQAPSADGGTAEK